MERDRNLLFGVFAVQLRKITPSQLVDSFLKGRNETIEVLAAYERTALNGSVTVAGGESVPLLDFIDRVSNHTSWHAAQLVPASSRVRLGGDR